MNGKPNLLKKKAIPVAVIITGIICLTLLEIVALSVGINGTLFTFVIALIGLAIGVWIPTPKMKM